MFATNLNTSYPLSKVSRRALSWIALLIVLPLLVFTAGCDDNGNGTVDAGDQDPEAAFSVDTDQLTASFDANDSNDPDGGNIASYAWDFGDGETGAGETIDHTYAMDGTYTVELTVTDDEGTTATTSQDVMVADNVVMITDDITEDRTLSADTTYMLNGLVFVGKPTDGGAAIPAVNDRPVLTIEPGTVIKALRGNNVTAEDQQGATEGASALIVRRSGRINADGDAQNPIIFTSEDDDLSDPADLLDSQFNARRGLWGGVIILGQASNNEPRQPVQVEGIPQDGNPALFGTQGGGSAIDDDDSGTFRYVSIRHGGFSITGVPGDEINGLTMGAVGSGTTIEFVEVYANFDDGFEWFGGTVHTNNLAAAFVGDDGFDYDQGFQGTGQFWFSIQDTDVAGRSGEHDGIDNASSPGFISHPVISNVTYIGSGEDAGGIGGDGNDRTFALRDVTAGEYYNSIFYGFPNVAVDIAEDGTRQEFEDGNIVFENNAFFGYGAAGDEDEGDPVGAGETADPAATFAAIINGTFADTYFNDNNIIADPEFAGVSRTVDNGLDPRPTATGLPPTTGKSNFANGASVDLGMIQDVSYHGAFEPGQPLWIQGWTALSAEDNLTE